jgi:hypothetical protein
MPVALGAKDAPGLPDVSSSGSVLATGDAETVAPVAVETAAPVAVETAAPVAVETAAPADGLATFAATTALAVALAVGLGAVDPETPSATKYTATNAPESPTRKRRSDAVRAIFPSTQ